MEKRINIYPVEEIFEDIPGDPDNVLMNFPPEVIEELGWTAGTEIIVEIKENMLTIRKKDTDV